MPWRIGEKASLHRARTSPLWPMPTRRLRTSLHTTAGGSYEDGSRGRTGALVAVISLAEGSPSTRRSREAPLGEWAMSSSKAEATVPISRHPAQKRPGD